MIYTNFGEGKVHNKLSSFERTVCHLEHVSVAVTLQRVSTVPVACLTLWIRH